jgi:hypothetical protein
MRFVLFVKKLLHIARHVAQNWFHDFHDLGSYTRVVKFLLPGLRVKAPRWVILVTICLRSDRKIYPLRSLQVYRMKIKRAYT